MRRVRIGLSTFLLALFATAVICPLRADADVLDLFENDIQAWRLEEARARLEKLTADTMAAPRALFLKGQLLFFEGDPGGALDFLRRALEAEGSEMTWKVLRDRVQDTKRVFDKLTQIDGASGRFLFRLDPSMDRLLLPYADETLNRQLNVLAPLLGDSPKRPVEVVFVSDAENLAAISGVSKDQIERTGTVAVTKYARIMIISPRNLVSGYPWLDTLAHELTHYVLTRASRDRVPIWLHEGIAKLLESRRIDDKPQNLSPEEAYLLDRAVREGRLIPFRRFHPSIAYLPNQEDAALAYAQVLSFVRYLSDRLPKDWLRRLTAGLAGGIPLDKLLTALGGADLQRFYSWWKQSMSGRRHTPVPVVPVMRKRFKRGMSASEEGGDSLHALEVRRFLRIGDLLRLRGHTRAAVEEFEKAKDTAAFASPEITDRLAAGLLELGEFKQAQTVLADITTLYPSHAVSFVQSARASVGLGEPLAAVKALLSANAVNPFDPEVHCTLSGLYRDLGNTDGFARENENCRAAVAVQKQSEVH